MSDSVPAPPSDTVELREPVRVQRAIASSATQSGPERGGRYEQLRMLGEGAMGAVYLVRDRETGEQLALKKLFNMDARSVLRLKREFRAVADMRHPNLVKVYELGHAADGYFLAMEYVPGQDLQSYLGFAPAPGTVSRLDDALAQLADRSRWLQEILIPAFRQLAAGVDALHRAGMLHRDLKPSNVMVAERRVVVLDFGLVRELDPNAAKLTEDGAIAGTPAYMPPEQALGRALSEASDWYAFGTMLYEALTGELPFGGTLAELLRDKLGRDPTPPEAINPELPRELCALCAGLLSRDPARRPTGKEVLACLQASEPASATEERVSIETSLQTETAGARGASFFGRAAEVRALQRSLEAAQAGQSQVVHVRGVSGTGKSSLVEHFLDDVEHRQSPGGQREALVLRSRCYEREAMPFKALDGVVDALTRHLATFDDVTVGHMMPADVGALVQLFPVLERVRAIQRLLGVRSHPGDAVHNRQRAEAAFRDLCSRLAMRQPLLIWIDDVQWGDLDSAGILKGFLQRPFELPLLLLLSYRSDEVQTSECLSVLLGAAQQPSHMPSTYIEVAALPAGDLAALSREQLGALAPGREALIEHIVREADGSPFLAAHLTALARTKLMRGDIDMAAISLSSLVAQTAALVSSEARVFLRVLAVAGRPIAPKLALRAAGLRGGAREIVHELRQQLLVRTRDVAGEKLIEVYHDRVRERVQQALNAAEAEAVHGNLLRALEYSKHADPDWLYTHAVGAKQRVAAFRYGLAAADRAMGALAFEHAAELYARAIELSDASDAERGELIRRLAEALAACGRGALAADAYLQATALATGPQAVQLMRLATSHLFRSARFEEAEAMLRRVLSAMGVSMPTSRRGVLLALLWERVRLALRGSRFTARSEAEIPAEQLERIDAFSMLRADLQSIDPLRATWFNLVGLRWALAAGEPLRLLHALSGVCHLVSMRGTARAERRSQQLLTQLRAFGDKLGTPAARATVLITEAVSSWMRGRPRDVLAPSYEAERLCREQPLGLLGDYYARFSIVSTRIGALYQLGDFRNFAKELRASLEEARASQNEGALLVLALNETLLDEIEGQSERAMARLEAQRARLPANEFGVFHVLHMVSVFAVASALDRYEWGCDQLERDWPRFMRSAARRASILSLTAHNWAARMLLNRQVVEGTVHPRLRKIRAQLDRDSSPWGRAYALAFAARCAYVAGDRARAIELTRQAVALDLPSRIDHTRYALGRMLGGSEGAALCAEAERSLREQGVADPQRFVRGHYPELFRAGERQHG